MRGEKRRVFGVFPCGIAPSCLTVVDESVAKWGD